MLFGGSTMLLALEVGNFNGNRWALLLIYQAAIAASAAVGFYFGISKINANGGIENLRKFVDAKKFLIKCESPEMKISTPRIALISAISVNIPLIFYIFTGARENAIFLAAPLFPIAVGWLNIQTFGPQLACLYLLRMHEIKAGRHFVYENHEELQDLRRTFFLSRWLMKDYHRKSAS